MTSETSLQPVAEDFSLTDGMLIPQTYNQLWRAARMYASSGLTPTHFHEKPAACAIAITQALRCGLEPLFFMQNTYVVGGKVSIMTTLAVALLKSSGAIRGALRFEFEGEKEQRSCTCFATDAISGETLSKSISMSIVRGEGWDQNKKWRSMPDHMLQLRSALWLARTYYPEVLLGLPCKEEVEDAAISEASAARVVETKPATVVTLGDVTQALNQKRTNSQQAKSERHDLESTQVDPVPPQEQGTREDITPFEAAQIAEQEAERKPKTKPKQGALIDTSDPYRGAGQ